MLFKILDKVFVLIGRCLSNDLMVLSFTCVVTPVVQAVLSLERDDGSLISFPPLVGKNFNDVKNWTATALFCVGLGQ